MFTKFKIVNFNVSLLVCIFLFVFSISANAKMSESEENQALERCGKIFHATYKMQREQYGAKVNKIPIVGQLRKDIEYIGKHCYAYMGMLDGKSLYYFDVDTNGNYFFTRGTSWRANGVTKNGIIILGEDSAGNPVQVVFGNPGWKEKVVKAYGYFSVKNGVVQRNGYEGSAQVTGKHGYTKEKWVANMMYLQAYLDSYIDMMERVHGKDKSPVK